MGDAKSLQIRLVAARQRLLELHDVRLDQSGDERRQALDGVALVGVDPEPGIGSRGAHRAHPRHVQLRVAGEFELQRRGLA